jgi:hypothetical protein
LIRTGKEGVRTGSKETCRRRQIALGLIGRGIAGLRANIRVIRTVLGGRRKYIGRRGFEVRYKRDEDIFND